MKKKVDIHKAGGILIHDRRLLVGRSKDKDFFIAPGGSLEQGETAEQALIRELMEEFNIIANKDDFESFGTFFATAAGNESKAIRMDVFLVKQWRGEPKPNSEVEELLWITSVPPETIKIGSIFKHEVLPRLKRAGLID